MNIGDPSMGCGSGADTAEWCPLLRSWALTLPSPRKLFDHLATETPPRPDEDSSSTKVVTVEERQLPPVLSKLDVAQAPGTADRQTCDAYDLDQPVSSGEIDAPVGVLMKDEGAAVPLKNTILALT